MKRDFRRDESGQVVVIVALMFTVLLGFSALAIDVGRYYAERRYIQDAADAAALACARTYALGGSTTDAYTAAADILTNHNLKGDPLGLTVSAPSEGAYTYYDNIVQPDQLQSGVLTISNPRGCRVALYVDVPTLLIQVANPALETLALNARAYAIAGGGFVPVIVPKYSNGPGPGDGDDSNFIHHTMRDGADYLCSVTSDLGCDPASALQPGRAFTLFGGDQKASNDAQFRGFLVLDIRDFTTELIPGGTVDLVHLTYNGVDVNANENTLKDFESAWIREGYPGPDICTVDANDFDRCAQVGIISGNSAGHFITEMADRYKVGDVLLAQLYDGTVKTIPNFTINFPNLIIGSGTAAVEDQDVSFTFSSQYAAAQTANVTVTLIADDGSITGGLGDALNPWVTNTATDGTFSVNPTPDRANEDDTTYTMTWSGITTTAAPKGIYIVFLRGVSDEPYETAQQLQIVTVNIDDQEAQFFIDSSDTFVNTADATGTARTATYTIEVTEGNGPEQWTGAADSVVLQIDDCPGSFTCYFGTSAPGAQTLATEPGDTHTLTVEVPSGTANNTLATGWLRAYGVDGAGNKVTRVLRIQTGVNVTTSNSEKYVDVIGYALFKIQTIDSNEVTGYAISGTYLDPNDPALATAKTIRLVPWEYVP